MNAMDVEIVSRNDEIPVSWNKQIWIFEANGGLKNEMWKSWTGKRKYW